MKKVTTWLLTFIIVLSFSGNVLAKSTYLSGYSPKVVGVLDSVRYSAKGGTEEITIDISKYSDYSILRLKNPERVAIDILGVDAPGRQQVIDVNSKSVKTIRYAQFDKGIARVVLDVIKQPEIKVKSENGRLIVLLNTSVKDDQSNSLYVPP
jgi:hypothetical protein